MGNGGLTPLEEYRKGTGLGAHSLYPLNLDMALESSPAL